MWMPPSLLPPDDSAYGFDNISDVLGVSPALQEQYLSAALKIGALAVGDPHITPGSETFRIRQDLSQNQHIEGMPLGTIGGSRFLYNFPLDGEYDASGQTLSNQSRTSCAGLRPLIRSSSRSTASASI